MVSAKAVFHKRNGILNGFDTACRNDRNEHHEFNGKKRRNPLKTQRIASFFVI